MRDRSLDIMERTLMAQYLLARGMDAVDFELEPDLSTLPPEAALTADLDLGDKFPAGLAPVPQAPLPGVDTTAPLPHADVLVITWTVDEQDALADVLTPGQSRKKWIRYNRLFEQHYAALIRAGAPSKTARRLGSWMPTQIGTHSVLCFKSELHLNQDGIRDAVAPGVATLPVKDLFKQLIDEVQPKLVITVGTSGGLYLDHDLGDIAVTRAAKFRLSSEFKNAPFNHHTFTSDWVIPTQHFPTAIELMQLFAPKIQEPPLLAPTARHKGKPYRAPKYTPDIKQDGTGDIPPFHPILTTDYFEYGTSTNHLEQEGLAVEMGDAVLGLACSELPNPPRWVVVRNLSDPQINGTLDSELRADYAVWYYQKFGYWTSVMSALTSWAIIAGLDL